MGLNFRKELTLGEFQVGNYAAGFVSCLPDPHPPDFPLSLKSTSNDSPTGKVKYSIVFFALFSVIVIAINMKMIIRSGY